ncbi:LysR family transcriptional regulator [Aureimonas sp. AU12]|uniref:LysR family transcriptional regulator n=1 Tax=Aureimonas sp. AU12 TaxID=1638161 RepID=UPI000781BB5C|nr:LysR family transcriptional regulator [Aureimonas sp. AU12]
MAGIPHLKALQAFAAFGTQGSVSGAARELGVSPGAVTQQLQKLEEHLGLALIERQGRHMELTRWGRLYHAEIHAGFERLSGASEIVRRARGDTALSLSALTSVLGKWIGREIFEWRALCPGSVVQLVGTEQEPDLERDGIDFRICYGPQARYPHAVDLFTDWAVPACSPRLIEGRRPTEGADIFGFPLLHIVWAGAASLAPSWEDWAALIGAPPGPIPCDLSTMLSSSAIDAAVAGRGFVLAQMSMIADELDAGRLVIPFDHRLRLAAPYRLAWSAASLDKPFARDFHRWLLAKGRRQGVLSAPAPSA